VGWGTRPPPGLGQTGTPSQVDPRNRARPRPARIPSILGSRPAPHPSSRRAVPGWRARRSGPGTWEQDRRAGLTPRRHRRHHPHLGAESPQAHGAKPAATRATGWPQPVVILGKRSRQVFRASNRRDEQQDGRRRVYRASNPIRVSRPGARNQALSGPLRSFCAPGPSWRKASPAGRSDGHSPPPPVPGLPRYSVSPCHPVMRP